MAERKDNRRSIIVDPHNESRIQAFRDLAQVVAELRQEAKEKDLDKIHFD